MQEEFLHFIWRYQLFDHQQLKSTSGQDLQILKAGFPNRDSGPDFFESRIKVNDQKWVGNIEIHVNTSDWFKHMHQLDPAYRSVILHVVYRHDVDNWEDDYKNIPVLELKYRIDLSRYITWERLQHSSSWIACEKGISSIPKQQIVQMIHSCAIGRLERKTSNVQTLLNEYNGHWERVLLSSILLSIGAKVNAEAMRILARLLPFELMKKNMHREEVISALVYGIAGFLDKDFNDTFPKELKKEFEFLKYKHKFKTMDYSIWKFLRMRPANFPSIRLAQFIAVFQNWDKISLNLFYQWDILKIENLLRSPIHNYWEKHTKFDELSRRMNSKMGKSMFELILINAIIPFFFSYGSVHADDSYKLRAMAILEQLPPENNGIISAWEKHGIRARNSLESQGLIELKNNFCSFKKCLSCKVGVRILNPR